MWWSQKKPDEFSGKGDANMWWSQKKPVILRIENANEIKFLLGNVLEETARTILTDIRNRPPVIKHIVKRNIPKPRRATLILENGRGEQYRQDIDLSYKSTYRAQFPVEFVTMRPEDISTPPFEIQIYLQYDPQDEG